MTQSAWENPPFQPERVDMEGFSVLILPPEVLTSLDAPEEMSGGLDEVAPLDPQAAMEKALAATQARQAAAEQKFNEDRSVAVAEVRETISALVDLFAEFDYPGAMIVKSLSEEKPWGNSSALLDVALWALDVPDAWGLGLSRYCFGADKRLYRIDAWNLNPGKKTYSRVVYNPVDVSATNPEDPFEIRDALNRFELPTEDTLLQ